MIEGVDEEDVPILPPVEGAVAGEDGAKKTPYCPEKNC